MVLFQPNAKFLKVLYGSAMVVFVVPLLIFGVARVTHGNENQQNDDQDEDNNYNNQGQYDNQQNGGCRWWQWGCNDNYQYEQNDSRDEEENALPWWWPWSEDERRREAEDMASPTLVVIYLWTLLMVGGILFYAYKTVKDLRDMVGLAVSLLMLANFAFISCLYLGSLEGAVQDDGRVIEEQGFYGQFGVLLYLTNLFATIFGVAWFFIIRSMVNDQHTTKVNVTPSDYMPAEYEAPSVKVNNENMA